MPPLSANCTPFPVCCDPLYGYTSSPSPEPPVLQPPLVTDAVLIYTVGDAVSYQISATQSPVAYTAIGLPSFLAINNVTGLITGTAAVPAPHTYIVPITATNLEGTGSGTLTINILPVPHSLTITAGNAIRFSPAPVIITPYLNFAIDGGAPFLATPGVAYPIVSSVIITSNVTFNTSCGFGFFFTFGQAFTFANVGNWTIKTGSHTSGTSGGFQPGLITSATYSQFQGVLSPSGTFTTATDLSLLDGAGFAITPNIPVFACGNISSLIQSNVFNFDQA